MTPEGAHSRGRVRVYQANHECTCYNCYVSNVTQPQQHSLKINGYECVVSDSLLWKGEVKFLSLDDQRKFCLGLPGSCPCIDYTDPEMASTDPNKPLSLKRKGTGSKTNEQPAAKKVDNRFLFDVTTEELENFMEGNA